MDRVGRDRDKRQVDTQKQSQSGAWERGQEKGEGELSGGDSTAAEP